MKKYTTPLYILMTLFLFSCGAKKTAVSNSNSKPKVANTESYDMSTREKKPTKIKEDPYVAKHLRKLERSTSGLDPVSITYIRKYADIAMEEMRVYKIPASITLAQGMLESGNGQSELATKSNNHFGIKCHKGWSGSKVYHDDDKRGECFRKYKYVHTSYKDHSLFLVTRSRYSTLFTYDIDDYKAWAKGLKRAGYATDKRYPSKLINLIELYQLEDFDAFVLDKKPKKYKKEIPVAPKGVHIVKKGETLYSISKLYDLEVEELIEMNDLSSNEIEINQGLIIYSSKKDKSSKPKKVVNREIASRKGWHTVQKGETLYSISKLYDMTPQGLADVNNLNSDELRVGQELKVNERISESDSFHQVKKGDTLYSISKQYGLTVDELKRLNQLSSNTISIGQKLRTN